MWRSGSLEKKLPKTLDTNYQQTNGESKLDNGMHAFKIDLTGNPNSHTIKFKKKKQMFWVLLDSRADVSLIHTRV